MSFILSLTAQQHKELKDVLAHMVDHSTVPDYASTMEEILTKLSKEPKQTKITNIVTGTGGITIQSPSIEN